MATGTVLVTGASTGIGEATVLHLKTLGFEAIGAVRKDEDAERLGGRGIRTVRIDVTDGDQIAAARDELGNASLAGLVNNAGIAVAAPIEFLPVDRFREQLEVNLIGQLAVTQAFLPALRRGGGRIVNLSSIGGRVALPLVRAYNASKFGLEGWSDSLRREIRDQGVDVILIEPGGVKTPIWDKSRGAAAEMLEGAPPEAEQLYGKMIAAVRTRTAKIETETGIEPREVADAIGTALTAEKPKTRYLVGKDAKQRARMAAVLPDRVMDRLIMRAVKG
jgi:NAD(P)-dependent dehydrogenase (short-subunit alcohol dehydrogenase family)